MVNPVLKAEGYTSYSQLIVMQAINYSKRQYGDKIVNSIQLGNSILKKSYHNNEVQS